MVLLIGDVPFDRLFRETLPALAEHVIPRLAEAHRAGLLADPEAGAAAAERAARAGSTLAVEAVLCRSPKELPHAVVESLDELRRLGLSIPPLGGGERLRRALDRLLASAPELTFQRLFTTPARDVDAKALGAIRAVREAGLFAKLANDRCCARGAGHDGVADLCNPNADTWCNLAGQDEDLCSIASTPCPKPSA
jgi:hypothetical protein